MPALAVLSGDNGLWTREYQREELVMDGSTENILLADDGETPLTGSGENDKTDAEENGSGGMVQTGENAGNREDLQLEGTESVRQEETETPDVSGTGKAEADVKRRRHRNFRTISASTASRTASRSTPRMRRGSIRYPIRQWCARPDFTTQRRAELTRFPPSICGGNSMAVCMGSTRRGFTGNPVPFCAPITSAQRDTLCTDKYNKLGQQASMGCVRLTVEDAKWIAENCAEGTTVEIYDGMTQGRSGNRRHKNWINQIRTATGIRPIRMRKIPGSRRRRP